MTRFIEERVNDLEKEIAELKVIVHQLRKPSTIVVEVDGDTAALAKAIEKTTAKTANELRAEIIDKAKSFVKEHSCGVYYQIPSVSKSLSETADIYFGLTEKLDFEVNEAKRTIVALSRCYSDGEVYHRGITKCHPDDVFNVDIGKAIALGKMLQLDVSEFENAVQPTLATTGTKVLLIHTGITDITEGVCIDLANNGINSGDVKILDDTNAIYEVK